MRAIFLQRRFQPLCRMIEAQKAHGKNVAAKRRDIVDDIGRAAGHDLFSGLFQHEYRRFTRNARDAAVQIDVCDHIAYDQNALPPKLADDRFQFLFHSHVLPAAGYHGVNCQRRLT